MSWLIEVSLPWPPTALSPNFKAHWSKRYGATKRYRQACWAITMAHSRVHLFGQLHMDLTFVRPNKRLFDLDNLVARMKSGIDGMADALSINDAQIVSHSARVAQDEVGGYVIMRLGEAHNEIGNTGNTGGSNPRARR